MSGVRAWTRCGVGLGLALLAGACGEGDGGEACVAQLCDPATFVARCHGLSVMDCAQDGRSYVFSPCNAQERCEGPAASAPVEPTAAAARCTVRACTRPGVSTCLNAVERETCLSDGSARVRETCPTGEGCRDGVCVPADCRGEADTCTTNGLLRCVEGAWQQTTCPSGQVCAMTGGVPSCGAPRCVPNALRCEDRRVHVCDGLGGTETEVPCAEGEVCADGLCRPPVCGEAVTQPDVLGGEVTPAVAELRFNAGGVVQVLTLDAQASYTQVGRRLTLSARRGLQRFEIRLAPIAEVTTGAWDSTVFNPTQVVACWDDGAGDGAGVGDCEAPFTHAATTWQVAIARNGGLGARVEGTFSFDMADINRDPLAIRDGSFSVIYR
jgi:hypothetical protein